MRLKHFDQSETIFSPKTFFQREFQNFRGLVCTEMKTRFKILKSFVKQVSPPHSSIQELCKLSLWSEKMPELHCLLDITGLSHPQLLEDLCLVLGIRH